MKQTYFLLIKKKHWIYSTFSTTMKCYKTIVGMSHLYLPFQYRLIFSVQQQCNLLLFLCLKIKEETIMKQTYSLLIKENIWIYSTSSTTMKCYKTTVGVSTLHLYLHFHHRLIFSVQQQCNVLLFLCLKIKEGIITKQTYN